ncbi:hypothetical protein NPIL_689911 [Nephila pilipes]|uniref:Uncharacterized protein n=1 Tax=Nephila pilipes TaxID=299642 RepID=A0A8X6U041_NEPPI|nr:hypothetical protein NPIL_689911 [Nephila pilipes]
MDSTSEKTAEAQNCEGKCSRQNSEQSMLDVSWKIDVNYHKKKLITQNASQVKQKIHTQISELVETLKERERRLCLEVDEECMDQLALIDTHIAKLSGHCCNTIDNAIESKSNEDHEKDFSCFPKIKLEFVSDFEKLKSRLKVYGEISHQKYAGVEYGQPSCAPLVIKPKKEVSSPTFEKWKKFNQKMEWFFKFVANDDELAKVMSANRTSDLNAYDDIYASDPRELDKENSIDEDDIEIISKVELAEIPSHSPVFSPEHSPKRKFFSGKRSLPVLPYRFFSKNPKDDIKADVEEQENAKDKSEISLPCSSYVTPSPEPNIEVSDCNKENKNSIEYYGATEAEKIQSPSSTLVSCFFEHFNNNKEEWLASKDDSVKWLSSKPISEKWLCSKDSCDKFFHSEEKLAQWSPHKGNPEDNSSWLCENLHQSSMTK